jgi:hypothetical protein
LASGNVGASDLQQAQPLAKQGMCKHMPDAASCKDEDADAANGQFLNHDVYSLSNNRLGLKEQTYHMGTFLKIEKFKIQGKKEILPWFKGGRSFKRPRKQIAQLTRP